MKKYSLKYHLLNESPILNIGNKTIIPENDDSELIPFNVPIDSFGSINAKLNRESFKELLYLLKLKDKNLLKNILSKYIKFKKTNIDTELLKEIDSLTVSVNQSKTLIADLINNLEIQNEPPSNDNIPYETPTYDVEMMAASYDRSIKNVFSEYLIEDLNPLLKRGDIKKITDKIKSRPDAKKIIDEIKTLQTCVSEIESTLNPVAGSETDKASKAAFKSYQTLSFTDIITHMPTEQDLQNTITNAVDAGSIEEFKDKLEVCFYQNCGLHNPKKVLKKIESLSKVAKKIKDIQTSSAYNDQEVAELFEEMNKIVKRITAIRTIVTEYTYETGINLRTIGDDEGLKEFFTAQGTKIGYLLEDIIGVIYNSSGGDLDVTDERLNIGAAATRTKPYALALCAVLLNKLDRVAKGGDDKSTVSLITDQNYGSSLKYFINNCLESSGAGNNKIAQFKINMNKIISSSKKPLDNSYMYNIDKVLGKGSITAGGIAAAKNSAFDFLICDHESPGDTAKPPEGTSIAVFDLKSSHTDSASASTARTPTGSNADNNATNELIRLSNVTNKQIVDEKGEEGKAHTIDELKEDDRQNFNIHSVSLIKVKWSIKNNFEIEDINASMTSLYGSTLESATHDSLFFFADDRELEGATRIGRSPLRNISLSNPKLKLDDSIKAFKKYLSNDENKIVKVIKARNQNSFSAFFDRYTKNKFYLVNDIIIMKNKTRRRTDFINFRSAIDFYMNTTVADLSNYKDESNREHIEAFQYLFEDEKKAKVIEYNLKNMYKLIYVDAAEEAKKDKDINKLIAQYDILTKNMGKDTQMERKRFDNVEGINSVNDYKKLYKDYKEKKQTSTDKSRVARYMETNVKRNPSEENKKKRDDALKEAVKAKADFNEINKIYKVAQIEFGNIIDNYKSFYFFTFARNTLKFSNPDYNRLKPGTHGYEHPKNKRSINDYLEDENTFKYFEDQQTPAQTPAQTPSPRKKTRKKSSSKKTIDKASYNRKGNLLREVYSHLFRK